MCDLLAVDDASGGFPASHFLGGLADSVVPALHGIQQEPVWPAIMDGHRPEDWSDSEPPPARRYHLVYLQSQDVLSHDHMLAMHSFYTFMLVSVT